ncbi:MAG TPA: serine hydrolase domain-containing protein [Candidatus Binatia bacterium]|jgi:CubicO group peptidase (beta-lactamase class C family)|nr:serine hydrolase domain-containing protein [Candidatus Binatia bacterium]
MIMQLDAFDAGDGAVLLLAKRAAGSSLDVPSNAVNVGVGTCQEGKEVSDMERIQPAMQGYIDEGKIAGISTVAIRQGEIIHSGCYGMLDIEAGKPLQPDSIFRIYSLTKPITAVALLMLIEEGSLELDDPISKYFPKLGQVKVYSSSAEGESTFEEIEREITIWHLLTHTSGLAYGYGVDAHPVEKMYQAAGFFSDIVTLQMSLEEITLKLADLPLAAQPETVWRYSIAYDLIGHLIQVITDKPFDVFLQERIFEPLEMIDTGFFVPEEKQQRFGAMYSRPEEGQISVVDKPGDSPFLDPDIAPSGGVGLVSTMSDYAHFLTMLINGGQWGHVRLVARDTVRQMTSNHLTGGQFPVRFGHPWPGMGYGLGVGVQTEHLPEAGWPAGTFGWIGISGVRAWVFPKESASIIAMPQARFYFEPADAFQKLAYEAIRD